jgi:myosin heavy subunit
MADNDFEMAEEQLRSVPGESTDSKKGQDFDRPEGIDNYDPSRGGFDTSQNFSDSRDDFDFDDDDDWQDSDDVSMSRQPRKEESESEPEKQGEEPAEEDNRSDDASQEDEELFERLGKLQEDLINLTGEDTVLKVKGEELKLKDLKPDEAVMYLQRGIRSGQIFDELSNRRNEIDSQHQQLQSERQQLNQLAQQLQNMRGEEGQKKSSGFKAMEINDHDDDETRMMKERYNALAEEMEGMRSKSQEAEVQSAQAQIESEIKKHSEDYPMASIDEVWAIKAFSPDTPIEKAMEASHNHYASSDFLEKAIKANPQFAREYEQKVIREYASKKQKSKPVSTRRSHSGATSRISDKESAPPRDFDDASDLARQYISEMESLTRK